VDNLQQSSLKVQPVTSPPCMGKHQKPQLAVLFQGLPVWPGLNRKNPQAGCLGNKSMQIVNLLLS